MHCVCTGGVCVLCGFPRPCQCTVYVLVVGVCCVGSPGPASALYMYWWWVCAVWVPQALPVHCICTGGGCVLCGFPRPCQCTVYVLVVGVCCVGSPGPASALCMYWWWVCAVWVPQALPVHCVCTGGGCVLCGFPRPCQCTVYVLVVGVCCVGSPGPASALCMYWWWVCAVWVPQALPVHCVCTGGGCVLCGFPRPCQCTVYVLVVGVCCVDSPGPASALCMYWWWVCAVWVPQALPVHCVCTGGGCVLCGFPRPCQCTVYVLVVGVCCVGSPGPASALCMYWWWVCAVWVPQALPVHCVCTGGGCVLCGFPRPCQCTVYVLVVGVCCVGSPGPASALCMYWWCVCAVWVPQALPVHCICTGGGCVLCGFPRPCQCTVYVLVVCVCCVGSQALPVHCICTGGGCVLCGFPRPCQCTVYVLVVGVCCVGSPGPASALYMYWWWVCAVWIPQALPVHCICTGGGCVLCGFPGPASALCMYWWWVCAVWVPQALPVHCVCTGGGCVLCGFPRPCQCTVYVLVVGVCCVGSPGPASALCMYWWWVCAVWVPQALIESCFVFSKGCVYCW